MQFEADAYGEWQALVLQRAITPHTLADFYGPTVYQAIDMGLTGPRPLGLPLPPVTGQFVHDAASGGMGDMTAMSGQMMGPAQESPSLEYGPETPGRRYHTLEKAQTVNAGNGFQ